MTATPSRWPVDRRGALLLAVAAVDAWLILPTAPNYDTASHLVWAGELLAGNAPDVDAPAAPTPHPLWLLLALPARLTGADASVMQLISVAALVVSVACAYRLAADIAGRFGGMVAAAATASSFALLLLAFKAYVDPPFLALTLTAVVLERSGRAPRYAMPALMFAAGLLRPEGWAFGVLLLALRLVRGRRALRAQLGPALVVIAAPVLWVLADLALTGNPLHSLSGTRELAEELGRPTGLDRAPKELFVLLGDLARPPIAAAGLIGVILATWLAGWRALLGPLAVLAAGCVGFLLVGALGLPLLQRYLLLPAVLLCVFAGIAGAAVLATALGRPLPGVLGARRLRAGERAEPRGAARRPSTALRAAAALGMVVAVAGAGGYLVIKAGSFKVVADGVLQEARWQRDAAELLDDPALRAGRCGPISLPTYRFVPELTLAADLDAGDVVSRASQLGGTGPIDHGLAFVIEGDRDAKRRLGWAAGVPRSTNAVPDGFTPAARRDPFLVAVSCPGTR